MKIKAIGILCAQVSISIAVFTTLAVAQTTIPVANNTVRTTTKAAAQPSTKPNAGVTTNNNNTISLDFQSVDTRVLLQLLAKVSGLSFIISDKVTGTMTLHVENISWQEALNIILKANSLGSRQYGNTLLIAPLQTIADSEILELQTQQRIADLAPLKSSILHLNYANAKDISGLLGSNQDSLLSARGHVGYDARTNSLWIRDTDSNIKDITQFVRRLDYPAPQVLIEAKVVSIDKSYEQSLGIRWGVTGGRNMSGTLNAANQLNMGTAPSAITNAAGAIDPTQRLNFNMPANSINNVNPSSLAFALISLGNKTFLDLELSALEQEQRAETISSPRVITSNQQPAYIEQGEEIPYAEATSSGATSIEFKKAVLSLKITPQITPDSNIILGLTVTQNTRGTQIQPSPGSNALLPPTINTQEVQSQVLLHNGETIALGGIYQRAQGNTVYRIPFLGKLPIVGGLFRNKDVTSKQNELIIFVTPTIINQANNG